VDQAAGEEGATGEGVEQAARGEFQGPHACVWAFRDI